LRDFQASARTFAGIGGYDEQPMNVSDEEHVAEREGAPAVVVLGWTVWQRKYQAAATSSERW